MRTPRRSARQRIWSGSIFVLILTTLFILSACATATTPTVPDTNTDTPADSTSNNDTTDPVPDDSAAPPVSDATVVLPYLSGGITSFDHAYWTSQLLISQGTIYEGLYGYDENLNIVPKVAESATPNEDNTVWTFVLRKDKKWSNGDPVTAHDYYASWVRFMSSDLQDAPMWAGFHDKVKNGWAFKGGAVPVEELGVRVIDDYTIEVTLNQPTSVLENFMVLSSAMPIHAATLEAHPTDWWDPANAVYNGPYIVESWVNGGDTTLVRNPNYVGDGLGNVQTIVLKPFADANARLQAFENGEIHFSFLEDASQVQYAQNNPLFSENLKEELALSWDGIQYDKAADDGPWADVRVRQAFAMAIDKDAIATQILRGLASPTNAFSGDPEITGKVTPLPYDVSQAQELLSEAGFPGGAGFPEVTFYAPAANSADMPVVEAIAKMWTDNLGVSVTIQNMEQAAYDTLRWGKIDPDTQPGYTMLSGSLNWFEPAAFTAGSDQIWWYMDFNPEWKPETAEYDRLITDAPSLTEMGDWDELAARADAVWERREAVMAAEADTTWGELMRIPPSFQENFQEVTARYEEAASDEEQLTAYKDALWLVLREEQDVGTYENLNPSNLEAQRMIIDLRRATMDEVNSLIVPINQLAVDSGWMVPIYTRKLIYVTAPELSGVVLNKLAWGHIFQFQYLEWNE